MFMVCDRNVLIFCAVTNFLAESLDELTDYIVPLFGDVENKNCEVPSWPEHPYGPNEVKVRNLYVETDENVSSLTTSGRILYSGNDIH